jgi:fructokinase
MVTSMNGMLRLGIDLGGSKIEIIVLGENGAVLDRRRVPTPQGDYRATLAAVVRLIEVAEREHGAASVGVGIPGAISAHTGLVKNANSTCLIGQPLKADLESLLHREVRVANDANCFALSEATDGAGQGHRVVFGVILGTGVGGGIVVDGEVWVGRNAIAGEWGHNPLAPAEPADFPLPRCYCGRAGCVETYLSGPALARDYGEASGDARDARQIVSGAVAGDAACTAAIERYEQRLARALSGVINVLDPDVIVLGGGLSNIERLYDRVPGLWAPFVFSDRVDTRLARNHHGDSSGVRGAAWLWAPATAPDDGARR